MAIDIEKMFSYQRPTPEQASKYEYLREQHLLLAKAITETCPPSREKELAIGALHVSNMQANASIALHSDE
jgi:hypothetical protein